MQKFFHSLVTPTWFIQPSWPILTSQSGRVWAKKDLVGPCALPSPSRFLSLLKGDFLGEGFPGRVWVEQHGTDLCLAPSKIFQGEPRLASPFSRVLLRTLTEWSYIKSRPRGTRDSSEKKTSRHRTHVSTHMDDCYWVSPYVDTCTDACRSFLVS